MHHLLIICLMDVLGKIPFKTLLYAGAFEMTAIIFTCYGLAIKEGHEKPFLPTISACGDRPPEVFIFRLGVVVGSVLIAIAAMAIYSSKKPYSKSVVNLTVGLVAALNLGIVAVVSDREVDSVHTASAVIFFVLENIWMVLITLQSLLGVSHLSLAIKMLCSIVGTVATVLRLIIQFGHIHYFITSDFPWLAVVEWIDTFIIIGFYLSLAVDFPGNYVGVVADVGRGSGKGDEELGLKGSPAWEKESLLMKD